MEEHSVDFFIHILEQGHCLNILKIGYKEYHTTFQTSITIKIFKPSTIEIYRNTSTIEISLKKSCPRRNQ